jgi:hypothetical protein
MKGGGGDRRPLGRAVAKLWPLVTHVIIIKNMSKRMNHH